MDTPHDLVREVAREVVNAAPPAAVVGLTILGIGLSDWAAIATIAYIVLQAAYLIYRWHRTAQTPPN